MAYYIIHNLNYYKFPLMYFMVMSALVLQIALAIYTYIDYYVLQD